VCRSLRTSIWLRLIFVYQNQTGGGESLVITLLF